MDSILTSVKKLLGVAEEYTHFDPDLIMHINSVFGILTQLGVGPSEGFYIDGDSASWSDFIDDQHTLNGVKSYIGIKVKMLFDPPTSASVLDAMNRLASELEWRLRAECDSNNKQQDGD